MMMVKKFEEFVSEGLWKKGFERSKSGEVRKEDGIKVKTCFGDDVILHNTNWDYNIFLKELFNYDTDNNFYTLHYDGIYTPEEQKNIYNGELDYIYSLDDRGLIAEFFPYDDELSETLLNYSDEVIDEHDYIAIIKSFIPHLKETTIIEDDKQNMCFELLDSLDDNDIYRKYDGDCTPISEQFNNFLNDFKHKFGNIHVDITGDIDAPIIYTDITFKIYMLYDNMREFTKEWFLNL